MSASPETSLQLLARALEIAIRDKNPEDLRDLAARWLPRGREAVNELLGKPIVEKSFSDVADFLDEWLNEDPAARLERRVDYPIPGLNLVTGGIPRGVLSTIAARTAIGKTALGLDVAIEHAARNRGQVLVASHELPWKLVSKRLACRMTGIARWKVDEGLLSPDERRGMADAAARLRTFQGCVNDSARDIDTAIEWIRGRVRKAPVDLILVDYLQLVANSSSTRRHEQIADATARLIDVAREADAALLCLAQVNRDGADTPMLHHLRDSGSIEQDSRVVIILDRPFARQVPESIPCEATAVVAKNGEGSTGTVKLHFDVTSQRFTDQPCACGGVTPFRREASRAREWFA